MEGPKEENKKEEAPGQADADKIEPKEAQPEAEAGALPEEDQPEEQPEEPQNTDAADLNKDEEIKQSADDIQVIEPSQMEPAPEQSVMSVEQRIKALESSLPNVKFTGDDKEALRSIYEKGNNADVRSDIHKFILDLQARSNK